MPKAKPVSLHPLSFDEAIKALMSVSPQRIGLGPQAKKKRRKMTIKKKSSHP
jgi:hypothetical protein